MPAIIHLDVWRRQTPVMSQLKTHRPRARRPRVGYITPRISDHNGLAIWSGMLEAARLHGVDVLCFAGGEVEHPEGAAGRANAIYDLVDRASLDGLVVWGSSLGYYAGPEATYEFCRQFEPLPLVSIGVTLPGIPGVVLDSYGGERALMAHLIEVHGRRRLAFIRGPEGHREARERYRAYRDALAEYGLPFDPELVSPPYLWIQADGIEMNANGAEAVRLFVEERRVRFDALVSTSDTFVLGALPALLARGIRVPEDVSVVGFDDKPATRLLSPALTTVQIRMRERGRQALELLLARLRGEDIPDEVLQPARLVVRRSCGCSDIGDSRVQLAGVPVSELASEQNGERRTAVLVALSHALEAVNQPAEQAAGLLNAFLAELEGEVPGTFLAAWDALLARTEDSEREVWDWQEVLLALREQMLPYLAGDPARLQQAEDLWHHTRSHIGERAWRVQARTGHYAGQQSDRLHAISRALALAVDVPELMDILARMLPELNIAACCVALYEDPEKPTGACRLVLAYDESGRLDLPPEGVQWPASLLASGGAFEPDTPRRSIVVEPLYYRDEQLGFIMLDGSRSEGQVYRVLQEQVSSALKSVRLLEENRQLYRAALAGQQAAQDRQRLAEEANRLKSRFLSMVSHELRTPLILLEGLSEMMLREGNGDRPPMPVPYRQDLARIRATSQQLSGLVRDVLDLSRSQMGQLRLAVTPVDLASVLQPTLLMGEQMAHGKGLDWHVEIAPGLPLVNGDAARLQEVTLNLIANAVKFTTRGEVRVRIEASDSTVTVSVSDTGLGVPRDEQHAIFDEFRQSERTATRGFGGLGVGLAICRQIIQLHGGAIGVHSSGQEEGGSRFFFTLPVLHAAARAEPAATAAWDGSTVVLLVEQADHGALLCTHLEQQGYAVEVLAVNEAGDWLARLSAAPPGAVILDLQPTWEYGWRLVDALRHNQATQGVPILLYSLLAERGEGAVLAVDYLAKPMGAAALTQALQNLGVATSQLAENAAILVVDDDPEIRALHGDLVRTHFPNCRILLAAHGRQALDLLAGGERPLFILLDLMMPELDGIGVLEAMQRDPQLRDIPVIVLTAQSLSEADLSHLNRGVGAILQKGVFSTDETLVQIERALARNRRLGSESQRLVHKVMAYMHANYAQDLTRSQLAQYAGLSERHLARCFAAEVGLSPMDYLNRYRIAQARRLLDESDASIAQVMEAAGFGDSSYFARIFRRETGLSPSAYRSRRQTAASLQT
jgi:signal transduction histidine kinase/DNA-binding LacI/PurR family transcriptional regulator/AraC-like DNA-binding protein